MPNEDIFLMPTEKLKDEYINIRDTTEWGDINDKEFATIRKRMNEMNIELSKRERESQKVKP